MHNKTPSQQNTFPVLKKGKLAWGIVLTTLGALGLLGIGHQTISLVLYILTCLVVLGVGILLLVFYRKDVSVYLETVEQIEEQRQKEERLKESRQELEQAKIDAELRDLNSRQNAARVCPFCGATTKGDICEYCGSQL